MFCYVLLCFAMFLLCFAMFCYVFAMFLLCFAMFYYVLLCFCYVSQTSAGRSQETGTAQISLSTSSLISEAILVSHVIHSKT